MRIAVTGASGLIGGALLDLLRREGHEALRIVRSDSRHPNGGILWDTRARTLDVQALEGIDGLVHLAGQSILGRWTDKLKKRIKDSRVEGTRLTAESLARMKRPPRTLVTASAIGFYGDRGDEALNESSPAGEGFLAQVCEEWEAAAAPAARAGIRTVNLRFGVVLSPQGGALAKMLPPFKLGLGGVVGDGRQYMSWISIDDAAGALLYALEDGRLSGAVNAVSPNPATNREFTRTLGKVLHRPTPFPMPAFAARLIFGEMADALLLASARVLPVKLQAGSFRFRHLELDSALEDLLSRNS